MPVAGLLIAVISIAIAWAVLLRPMQQRSREHRDLVASLGAGDRIITAGGLYGTIVAVGDEELDVELAPGVVVTLARAAVRRRRDVSEEQEDRVDTDPAAGRTGDGPDGPQALGGAA